MKLSNSDLLKNLNSFYGPTGPPNIQNALMHSSSLRILKIAALGSRISRPRVMIHSVESPVSRKLKRTSVASDRNVTYGIARSIRDRIYRPLLVGLKFAFSQFPLISAAGSSDDIPG